MPKSLFTKQASTVVQLVDNGMDFDQAVSLVKQAKAGDLFHKVTKGVTNKTDKLINKIRPAKMNPPGKIPKTKFKEETEAILRKFKPAQASLPGMEPKTSAKKKITIGAGSSAAALGAYHVASGHDLK